MKPTDATKSPPSNARRQLLRAIGWLCVALGLIGAALPLMPTTVFLLIAAWAFAQSDERWHRWLREHSRFGEAVRAWEEHHAMPRRAKRIAFLALALSYVLTAFVFGPLSWAALIGGVCIAGVAIYIAHIPVVKNSSRGLESGRTETHIRDL